MQSTDNRLVTLLRMMRAALEAVEPSGAVRRFLMCDGEQLQIGDEVWTLPFKGLEGAVRLIAAGKASIPMARSAAGILGSALREGVVVTRKGSVMGGALPEHLALYEAGHPIPDEYGVEAVRAIEQLAEGVPEDEIVLALLSGGASALLADPAPGLNLIDIQKTTELLLASGAPIGEINAVRKHLSRLKGGQLARLVFPARLGVLILSDVVGDPLDVIASGPTAPDCSTYEHAWRILEHRDLIERIPEGVLHHLREGLGGRRPETPKPGDAVFSRVKNVIVGSCLLAAEEAARTAVELGYQTLVLTTFVEGEAREAGKVAAALVKGVRAHGHPVRPPACLIWGGETTVTLRGKGKGGRNQELALSAALALEGAGDVSIMALATDGSDGPTDAAGAVVDGHTASIIRERGIDPLSALLNNDSHTALDAAGALIRIGPTGTNVNDLLVALVD